MTVDQATPALVAADDAALAAMTPSSYVTPETLQAGDPAERDAIHLTSADEKFIIGSWEAQPYTEFIEAYPGDEYASIISGEVTLTGDDGVAHTFGAGQSFTLRRGWRGQYQVTEPLLKHFTLYLG